eukprot:1743303-Rhodomonas_salina.1
MSMQGVLAIEEQAQTFAEEKAEEIPGEASSLAHGHVRAHSSTNDRLSALLLAVLGRQHGLQTSTKSSTDQQRGCDDQRARVSILRVNADLGRGCECGRALSSRQDRECDRISQYAGEGHAGGIGLAVGVLGICCQVCSGVREQTTANQPDSTVTCWEAFYGRAPNNSILHPFCCLAYLHMDVNHRQLKKLSETSVECVFLGFTMHLGHKGYLLKALNRPSSQFPYRKPLNPDYVLWHVEDKHHHLTFELLEDHDGPIEPVTPENIEIILEDEDEEKGTAPSLQTIDELEVHTREMKRARIKGENEGDRVVGSAGSGEEQVQQSNEKSASNIEEFQQQRTETETGVYFDEE